MSRINLIGVVLIAVLLISLGLGLPGTIIRAVSPIHPADLCDEDASWSAVDFRDPLGIEDIHGVTRRCVYNDSHLPQEVPNGL